MTRKTRHLKKDNPDRTTIGQARCRRRYEHQPIHLTWNLFIGIIDWEGDKDIFRRTKTRSFLLARKVNSVAESVMSVAYRVTSTAQSRKFMLTLVVHV